MALTVGSGGGGGGGAIISAVEPDDTDSLWIDISSGVGILKYYSGSSWVSVNAVWG